MLILRLKWLLLACAAVTSLSATSCSVDSKVNRGRRCDGTCVCHKGFCLADGRPQDGGAGDADAGHVPSPCAEEGAVELCYEGDPRSIGKGLCEPGLRTCRKGLWSTCEGQHLPAPETCNNEDDDCDAVIDEDVSPMPCTSDHELGACTEGIEICRAGQARCISIVDPVPEMCGPDFASQDLDCDGFDGDNDPDLALPCYEADDLGCVPNAKGGFDCKGECRPGLKRCDGPCEGAVYITDEEATAPVDGGLPEIRDEDCDGKFDEDFACSAGEYACYTGPASTRGVGACKQGTRSCGDAGLGPCENEVTPTTETCANEGADDDCNGVKDDIPGRGDSCALGSATPCHVAATLECEPNSSSESLVCTLPPGEPEVCDGIDNDCDMQTDEGSLCGSNVRACCDSACVDTQYNDAHCGGCGNVCGDGLSCCGGRCVNRQRDSDHCGACHRSCAALLGIPLATCQMGSCSL